jgi:hypothetical protein
MANDFSNFGDGKKLYGADFNEEELQKWFSEEINGYKQLASKRDYVYEYHALNAKHAYSKLDDKHFQNILAYGSAYLDEIIPIQANVSTIYKVDIDSYTTSGFITDKTIISIQANHLGLLDICSQKIDLVTCFGALHHVANPGTVIKEFFRVMSHDSYLVVREPIVSMGNWDKPRIGLTKNERGIPYKILIDYITEAGFEILYLSPCDFSPMATFCKHLPLAPYNNPILTLIDSWLSRLFFGFYRYHRHNFFQKFAPASLALVCKKG